MPPRPRNPTTFVPESRRTALTQALADIVLRDGLGGLGLRGLAASLGTSDRMLIYYFGTKEQLILDTLDAVSTRLAAILEANAAAPRMTPGRFLTWVLAMTADPAIAPFMRLWTDVVARAARGEAPYDRVGPDLVRSWTGWIETRLTASSDPVVGAARPAALLSIVEGLSLLEDAAPGSSADVARYLSRQLDARPAIRKSGRSSRRP